MLKAHKVLGIVSKLTDKVLRTSAKAVRKAFS